MLRNYITKKGYDASTTGDTYIEI